MKANVGTIDKAIRVILGVALIAVAVINPGMWWGWIGVVLLATIGVVLLATVLLGWCPAYHIFGISTCPAKKVES